MADIAVIGAGLIGRAWAIVFLRGGHDVALWDPDPRAVPAARDFIAARLPELRTAGLLADPPQALLARLGAAASLEAAVAAAVHVQENGPERAEEKTALFARLDAAAPPGAVLASSTSTLPASRFTEALPGRARCLVAHPVNPPYLVPVVELCPAPWTDADTVARTAALMTECGMVPATVRREIPGFLLNRLQAALLGEAFRLVADGVASAEDVDATVKHGLGLRWAFMGPFETIDLNAPGGLTDYCARYGDALLALQRSMTPRAWDDTLVAALEAERRAVLPQDALAERTAWRDRRLMALLAHKAGQGGQGKEGQGALPPGPPQGDSSP
jgi:3-hydroxyacyl-CoA dehydrogenase